MIQAPATIVCVDCGGRCHLLTHEGEDGWDVGQVVTYRCEECHDRWDVELTEEDDVDQHPEYDP
jgi:DNA-directed RNA polymerase subunit RPC12/RpoP